MSRFVEGQDRSQVTLIPECLDDFIAEDNPVRVVDAFVQELDLGALGFEGAMPASTGRPSYDPAAVAICIVCLCVLLGGIVCLVTAPTHNVEVRR